MASLHIFLFGKFRLQLNRHELESLEAQKTQELLCYLLLYRARPHFREKLATLLWDKSSASQAKRYLRQALWQLQSALHEASGGDNELLTIESDWLQINPAADFWLDVQEFEQAFALAQGRRGHELDVAQAQALQAAARLYHSDLLENWYQDWCLFERERLQNMYLVILDKLMSYFESQQEYETGLLYGLTILRCDHARERTHRRLMRLRYLAGDRTGALRQYELCAKALDEELGVQPTSHTTTLYDQIRCDSALALAGEGESGKSSRFLRETLSGLNQLQATLSQAQRQLERDIEAVRLTLSGRR